MEAMVVILSFFAVIFLTAVIFVFWVAIVLVRGVIRGVTKLASPAAKRQPVLLTLRCVNDRCRTNNAPNARFCRRCGQQLVDQRRYASPRAALW